jgi:8-oxo-dGTP diphosphatase
MLQHYPTEQGLNMTFEGAKIALYVVVILRDDFVGLPYASFWDLLGGGRDGSETLQACVTRECFEKLGLVLSDADIEWARAFDHQGVKNWFFVGRLPATKVDDIVLGDEGQRWALMKDIEFIQHSNAVPLLQNRLGLYLSCRSGKRKAPRKSAGGR